MSYLSRIFAGDEELGKKDDDHRPLNGDASIAAWSARKPAQMPRWRGRKVIYGFCVALFLYLFVKNIPTDLGPNNLRADSRVYQPPREATRLPPSAEPPKRKPPHPTTKSEAEEHYHNGPIKFYKLAASLHAVARLGGQHDQNKNVLFAASGLKSVSEVLPLACEMARWERNDVHLALMGRDDMDVEDIKQINGAEEDCNINWHDARPDFSPWSSDFRMEVSVTASMDYIQTFVHPQIIIIDDPTREDAFFVDALRSKVSDLGKAIIELPSDATETMMWMTRLDSGSLAAWSNTYIDIFIQAPKESSGSLVRLLKSIQDADYFGTRRPHLTIELPAEVDQSTWAYLQNFVWPPLDWSGVPHASQVTLRHRIPRRTASEEEASARLVESFYPVREEGSSVLLLSPQAELSPLYFHFVMYTLLEYKYSKYNRAAKEAPNVMGFSLELPANYPNDTTPFDPPRRSDPRSKIGDRETGEKSPFLWQSPNANAALYFGNKWIEFHSFLSNRLSKPPSDFPKLFTKAHPAWLEFMLEFMRTRGYSFLYPNFPSEDTALVTIHSDLYHPPEEFTTKSQQRSPFTPSSPTDIKPDSDLTVDPGTIKAPTKDEKSLLDADLVSLLPSHGDLPELANLPLMTFSGEIVNADQLAMASYVFSNTFRSQTGACASDHEQTARRPNSADDLFCHLEELYDYHHDGTGTNVDDSGSQEGADGGSKQPKNRAGVANGHSRPGSTSTKKMSPEDQELYDSLHPGKSEVDAGDDSQRMFRAQMERQSKQQKPTARTEDEPKTKVGSDDREKADEESKKDTTTTLKTKAEEAKKEAEMKFPAKDGDTNNEKTDREQPKKKAGSATAEEKSKSDPDKTEKETVSDAELVADTIKDTPAARDAAGDEDATAEKESEIHGSFNKEAPKPIKEADMAAIATAKEKSPGW